MTESENEVIWYKNISVLTKNINKLWPQSSMTPVEQINALTRTLFIVSTLGYLATGNLLFVLTGVIFIVLVSVYGYAKANRLVKEGFTSNVSNMNNMNNITNEPTIKNIHSSNQYELSTPSNPMSNVLLTEIHDNPTRKPAPPSYLKDVETEINKNTMEMIKNENPDISDIDKRLFTEVGDNFMFDRGMRQFYSMPNTQVPNDQGGFAEFCYGSMISCKEGHETACHRNAFRHLPGY